MCIRKALADGRLAAFIAGLGAAAADTFYGAVAALGLRFVNDFLTTHKVELSLVGGLFLMVLGARALRRPAVLTPEGTTHAGLIRDFLSTFMITLTNPGTVLAFMAVFASFSVVTDRNNVLSAGELILGVFVGSTLWWAVLSAAAGAVRSHFTPLWLTWLNRLSGSALLLFGLGVLGSIFVV
ncbi:lysine transporter LysE [Pararhodospirillum oryzae]|uniref:Lysine transporter LysE n=1 Tax=Pararhodospirillum oryzae TaxID=478448 RepID=A0A512HAS7_9PROT|nr:lysine transporter LysE [Pararhodospirillum oryzae]